MWQTLAAVADFAIGKAQDYDDRRAAGRRWQAEYDEAKRQFNINTNEAIQRRVKDAQEAGIHPLFALGGSVGTSPTSAIGGTQQPQSRSQASLSGIADAALKASATERNQAEAALLDAERARMQNAKPGLARTFPYPNDEVVPETDWQPVQGLPKYVPPEIPFESPTEPGVQAGTHSLLIRLRAPDGTFYYTINPELGWDELLQPGTLYAGYQWLKKQYGAKAAEQKLREELESKAIQENPRVKAWRGKIDAFFRRLKGE